MESIKAVNAEQLIELLDSLPDGVRGKVTVDALIAGANFINQRAESALNASKKGESSTEYSYYATSFKQEKLKAKTPDELGVRTGVWNRKNGYKLRWLEWGTVDRNTFLRRNYVTGKVKQPRFTGKVKGNHFFFNAVRNSQDEVFKILSDAIIKSLEEHAKNTTTGT